MTKYKTRITGNHMHATSVCVTLNAVESYEANTLITSVLLVINEFITTYTSVVIKTFINYLYIHV